MTTSALPLIPHKNSKSETQAATCELEPRKPWTFKSWGVRDFLAHQEGLLPAPGLAYPPDPREAPAGKANSLARAGVPGYQPHLRGARRRPAPPPPVLTLTLAHPAAAGPRVGLAACLRRRGYRSPPPSLRSASSLHPAPSDSRRQGSPSPQSGPRVSPAGSSGRGLWDALAPAKASGCAHAQGSGSGRGGTCGA